METSREGIHETVLGDRSETAAHHQPCFETTIREIGWINSTSDCFWWNSSIVNISFCSDLRFWETFR
ncbi:hypothetical protein M7I_3257 [Glarea lozoyensis 74030]|uniref:Uncharacterized protein n=1 Tax=Glarea lozoyensis (strain ATCC 74030 / MF5533) TaxID=1104152 RepID=H0EL21_GLAL7|nr:hypothetical protein M7I_3257 [Glarea lozoyensis 74030]